MAPIEEKRKAEMETVNLSVVIPVYNEEQNISPLFEELVAAVDPLCVRIEFLLVDDGSTDQTFAQLKLLAEKDERVRIIRLSRNFGQTAAMQAGFDLARGRIIVSLDADLQNDPADISRLVEEIEQGYDIVCGWRRERKGSLLRRKLPSVAANWLIRRLTGLALHDQGCTLKAFRREILKRQPLYSDMHRFIPLILTASGGTCREISVNDRPRGSGKSKYGLGRTWSVLVDLMTVTMLHKFSTHPGLWFAFWSAPFLLMLGFVAVVLVLQLQLSGQNFPPSVVPLAVLLVSTSGTLHLLMLAVLGELAVLLGTDRRQPVSELVQRS